MPAFFLNHLSSTTSERTLEHIKPPRTGRLNPRIISVGGEDAPSFPSCRRRVASAPDQARPLVRSARVALRELLAAVHAVPVPLQQHARRPRNHHCLPGLPAAVSMPAARPGSRGTPTPRHRHRHKRRLHGWASHSRTRRTWARIAGKPRSQTPVPAPRRLPPSSAAITVARGSPLRAGGGRRESLRCPPRQRLAALPRRALALRDDARVHQPRVGPREALAVGTAILTAAAAAIVVQLLAGSALALRLGRLAAHAVAARECPKREISSSRSVSR